MELLCSFLSDGVAKCRQEPIWAPDVGCFLRLRTVDNDYDITDLRTLYFVLTQYFIIEVHL